MHALEVSEPRSTCSMRACAASSAAGLEEEDSLFAMRVASPETREDGGLFAMRAEPPETMEDGFLREDGLGRTAVAQVDSIIARATGTLSICDDPWRVSPSEKSTPSGSRPSALHMVRGPPAAPDPMAETGKTTPSMGGRARRAMRPMGTGAAPNPARGNEVKEEIANIIAAGRNPSQVRAYVELRNFGRVPPFLAELRSEIDEEQERIAALQEEMEEEMPRRPVRLLAQGEKDELIYGLKQQLQQATAMYSNASPTSRYKDELEDEMERLTQDIENLSRPYIFVEDDG